MQYKKILLVTTAIKETHEDNKNVIFLGEWCKPHDDENPGHVMQYHCEDRKKFEEDHNYLDFFYESLLLSLSKTLNDYHHSNHSIRYWRIIIGPWLQIYISAVWDRWENLRVAFEKYEFDETVLINYTAAYKPPNSYDEANCLLGSNHFWNHMLYSKILKNHYSSHIKFINISCKKFLRYQKSTKPNKRTIKDTLVHWTDRLLEIIQVNERVVFVSSYFDLGALIKISLKLGQIPRVHTEFRQRIKLPNISPLRNKINIDLKGENSFELFLISNIVSDIPISYIEGYKTLKQRAALLLPNCSVIFSANAHYNNELFKVFCAEKINLGKKLITSQHGGGARLKYSQNSHEVKISDVNVVWRNTSYKNQIRLPPNKIVNRGKGKKNGCELTIVSLEFPLYLTHYISGTHSSLILDDYNQKLEFINNLDKSIKNYLKIRADIDYGWNIKQRYINKLGIEKISPHKTLLNAFDHSKVIVCTYPETTLSEAIYSEIPTILLYKEEYWEPHSENDNFIHIMEEANIIFSNPITAANHINKVWDDPYAWWNSPRTINSRKKFLDEFVRTEKNWLKQWSRFFKDQLSE